MNIKKDKKASIAATMTWLLATIIILLVVVFFVYASYTIGKKKDLLNFEILKKKNSNIEAEQTLLALMQTKINGKAVNDYILDGSYSEVKEEVENILEILDIKGKAEVYVNDNLVKLDGDDLEIK